MQEYGLMANAETSAVQSPACQVCDDPRPAYSWTDYSGEATCMKCGTSYQLKWGELEEGESYPRINVKKSAIPMLRRYFAETGKQNGCGTIMSGSQYPEIVRGRNDFSEWWQQHKDEYPEFS
jgi:hypothetical protein